MSEPSRKVEVARKENTVIVAINCADEYAAMLLYDEVAAELAAGYLALEIETK